MRMGQILGALATLALLFSTTPLRAQEGPCTLNSIPDRIAYFAPRVVAIHGKKPTVQYSAYSQSFPLPFDQLPEQKKQFMEQDFRRELDGQKLNPENYDTLRKRFEIIGPDEESHGSGVILDGPDGPFVQTNNHVIEGLRAVTVVLSNGTELNGKVLGTAPDLDLAAVGMDDFPKDFVLPKMTIAPADTLRMGEPILVIGNAANRGVAPTFGIISSPQETNPSAPTFMLYVRVDAPMNQGASGGALISACNDGVLIGIPDFILRNGLIEGFGYSILAASAARVMPRLAKGLPGGDGWLGVTLGAFDGATNANATAIYGYPQSSRGLLVSEMVEGSPAKDKLSKFDLLTEMVIDGVTTTLASPEHLISSIIWMSPGEKITFSGLRPNKPTPGQPRSSAPFSVEIEVGKNPA